MAFGDLIEVKAPADKYRSGYPHFGDPSNPQYTSEHQMNNQVALHYRLSC